MKSNSLFSFLLLGCVASAHAASLIQSTFTSSGSAGPAIDATGSNVVDWGYYDAGNQFGNGAISNDKAAPGTGTVVVTNNSVGTATVEWNASTPAYKMTFNGGTSPVSGSAKGIGAGFGAFAGHEGDALTFVFNDLGVGTHTVTLYFGHTAENRIFDMDYSVTATDGDFSGTTQSSGSVTAAKVFSVYEIVFSTTDASADLTLDFGSVSGDGGTGWIGGYVVKTGTSTVGPVDPGESTVAASPVAVPADNTASSTITVTLKDSGGFPVAGQSVTLAGSTGNATIIPAGAQTTSASGQATFMVRSGTIESETFTATDVTDSPTTVEITETASVAFQAPSSGSLLFYEPFDYLVPTDLNDSTWTAIRARSYSGSTGSWNGTFNGTTQIGNYCGGNAYSSSHVYFYHPLDPSVTATFIEGSVTWFSFVTYTEGGPQAIFDGAIGAGEFNTMASRGNAATDQAIGMGTKLNNGNSNLAIAWDQTNPGDNYTVKSSSSNLGNTRPRLMVAKITWSDSGDDTIEVAAFGSGSTPTEADFNNATTVTTSRDLNQSQFDKVSFASVGTFIDEVRIATSFDLAISGTGNPISENDYDAWRSSYSNVGGPDDDDDQDGLSNDDERTFGLDPTDASSSDPVSVPFDATTGTFSYTRRTQSLTNLAFRIWYSTDLETWFRDLEAEAGQAASQPLNDIETVAVQMSATVVAESKFFARIEAVNLVTNPESSQPELQTHWGHGDTVTLNFSEKMNVGTATDIANYSLELDGGGNIPISSVTLGPNGKVVTLNLDSTLGTAATYNVSLSNLFSGVGLPLMGSNTARFTTWDNDPDGIKVFILAGQSNMVGKGHSELGADNAPGAIGTLRYLAVNNGDYPEYDYTSLLENPSQASTSDWATRSDVKVWWRRGYVGNPRNVTKGNHGVGFGDNGTWIGPEYAFGQILGDLYDEPVLIIKCAWGGIDLVGGFRSASAVAARGGSVGPYYNSMVDDVRRALSSIDTEFPDMAGQGYQIVGFGWHQGYNDVVGGLAAQDEYEENLKDLINDVRVTFARPDLPFSIATTSMFVPEAGDPNNPVELAQLALADPVQRPEFHTPSTVATVWTGPFWRDPLESPATTGQAFHWNHNAETYFLIGHHMGTEMVRMLAR